MTTSQTLGARPAAVHAGLLMDRASPVPLYHQLTEQLAKAIQDGRLLPGDNLENEVSLADRLNMSRPTVRRAIGELVSRGLVVRRRGVGTKVAHQAVHRRCDRPSLNDDLIAAGLVPTTTVLTLVFGQIDHRAALALGLAPKTPLVAFERVRYVEGSPIAILRNWLALPLRDLSVADLETKGLYELLRGRGIWPSVAQQSIGSRAATPKEQHLLALGRADPVLTVTQMAFEADGRPIEFGEHSYRSDRYRFEVTLGPLSPAA